MLLLLTSVISFSGAVFVVLEEVREGKGCPFHICCTDKNQMYLLASGWHFGSAKLPTPILPQSDGMNSRAVLYYLLAYKLSTWAAYESIHLKLSFQVTAQFSNIILEKSLAHASPFLLAHRGGCVHCVVVPCHPFPPPQISWCAVVILSSSTSIL